MAAIGFTCLGARPGFLGLKKNERQKLAVVGFGHLEVRWFGALYPLFEVCSACFLFLDTAFLKDSTLNASLNNQGTAQLALSTSIQTTVNGPDGDQTSLFS